MNLRGLFADGQRAIGTICREAAAHPRTPLLSFLFLVAIGYAYWSAFEWVVHSWMVDKEYSHGFLVLPVSLYFVYFQRGALSEIPAAPRKALGGLALFSAGFLLLAGKVSGFTLAEAISFLFLLPALVLYLFGWTHLRLLSFPLLYLQFGVPWADELIYQIQPMLQRFSAAVGQRLLELAGLPVFRDDKMIYLPKISMEVARECSGVNFLISVLALGLPLVYLTQRSWWRALSVLAGALGLTILTNGARVAVCGVMGNTYGPAMLHGPAHIFQGWSVAQVGVVVLFVLNWGVSKIPAREQRERLCNRAGGEGRGGSGAKARVPAVSALLVLLGLGIYANEFSLPRPVPLSRPLDGFPKEVGRWQYAGSSWLEGKAFFPGTAAELSRVYRDGSGRQVGLYVGYYDRQGPENKLVNFRASPLREGGRVGAFAPGGPGPREVVRSRPVLEGAPAVLTYWYRLPSGEVASRYRAKLRSVTDGLFFRRNNGAVVVVGAPLRGDEAGAERDAEEFARLVAPLSREFLP